MTNIEEYFGTTSAAILDYISQILGDPTSIGGSKTEPEYGLRATWDHNAETRTLIIINDGEIEIDHQMKNRSTWWTYYCCKYDIAEPACFDHLDNALYHEQEVLRPANHGSIPITTNATWGQGIP